MVNTQEIKNLFSEIIFQLNLPVAIYTIKGDFLTCNNSFTNRSGYTYKELLNFKLSDISSFTNTSLTTYFDNFYDYRDFLTNKYYKEETLKTKDDTEFLISIERYSVNWPEEQSTILLITDISLSKKAELITLNEYEELKASYQQIEAMNQELEFYQIKLKEKTIASERELKYLETALWGANIGLWEYDIKSHSFFINEKASQILGYSHLWEKGYITYDEWAFNLHDEDKDYVLKAFNEHVNDDSKYYETRYRVNISPDQWKWILARGKATQRVSNGRATKIVGTIQDITNFRKDEIIKSIILSAISDHVLLQNTDHTIIWANEAAAASVKLKPEDLINKKCYEIWHQRKTPCENCPVEYAIKNGKTNSTEIYTPDNRSFFIKAYPIFDEMKNITSIVEVTTETTHL
ncbi:hypothetical protein SYNTR_1131 [Candidatus Syntrophocurvum alkaliphilum]|uniref:histidine kinase n=1 Tax=Candidatus Syntrophocurvum alkaliphilum TaxID=2293317 RepID=A0A6I6DIN6_9FIRM|nr:PAS domain-containing protein [Candidatus Syntrophocurvum alkaliphilum]QGT99724.1 hypothetical protein SYNTR_1131 [Candidatus Syntrophocurvum alkaliphilum]